MRKSILNAIAVFALATGAMFAQTTQADTPTTGRVRVVHLSPDAPAVDIYVNGSMVLEGMPYREYSDYLALPAGNHTVAIKVSGTDVTVKTVPITVAPDTYYTAAAVGYASGKAPGFDVLWLTDDLTLAPNHAVKLRVLHSAPGAPAVDVYVTTPFETLMGKSPVLSGVPFGASSGYLAVPVNNYQARITLAGTMTVAINSGRLVTWNDMIRTVAAVDTTGGGGPFDIILLPDRN
jgi:hypothetical protein